MRKVMPNNAKVPPKLPSIAKSEPKVSPKLPQSNLHTPKVTQTNPKVIHISLPKLHKIIQICGENEWFLKTDPHIPKVTAQ